MSTLVIIGVIVAVLYFTNKNKPDFKYKQKSKSKYYPKNETPQHQYNQNQYNAIPKPANHNFFFNQEKQILI